jgi:predicted outer membrane repeat protein
MQKLTTRRASQAAALAFAIALVAMACALMCPGRAFAADASAKQVAHALDYDGKTVATYTSAADAVKDCIVDLDNQKNRILVMDADWGLAEPIKVTDSMFLTIDMNGHKIAGNGKDYVFRLCEHSKLTLKSSSAPVDFSFTGYWDDGSEKNCIVSSGGMVTGGNSSDCGGIAMDADSALALDNVAIAGNKGGDVGGIRTKGNCGIYMSNGATIQGNGGYAGGVRIKGEDTSIYMDNASISDNYATMYGGGIYSDADATRIFMTNRSTIYNNKAKCAGGGILFNHTYFHLESSDGTGSISDNKTVVKEGDSTIPDKGKVWNIRYGGGAIFVRGGFPGQHEGTIKGLTISGNKSSVSAGAIYVDEAYTRISECTIKGNSAAKCGGGVYVGEKECSLTNCTITGNFCNTDGGNYEGGGVYVNFNKDITLSKKCVITDNTRGRGGSADDLFLGTATAAQSYILGGAEEGSSVGIRTGSTDKTQMIGKNISTYADGIYFMDLDEYRVTHGSDHNGDLWQRKVDPVAQLDITVKAPKTDEKFPAKATLSWDGGGSKEVAITWYDANNDTEVSGTAQHDGKYYFKLSTPEDLDSGLTLSTSLTTDGVQLYVKDNKWNAGINYAHVDDSHVLSVTSGIIEAADPEVYGGDDGDASGDSGSTSGTSGSEPAETEQVSAVGSGASLVQTGDSLPMGMLAIAAAGVLASMAVGAFVLRRSRR